MASNSTASSIVNSAWAMLRTSGSSTDIPALQQNFMLTMLNQANAEWVRAFRRGGGAGPTNFQKETGYTLVAETTINQATVLPSATSFVVSYLNSFDTTNGAGVIWSQNMPDIFQYTTATVGTETFSGVTGIGFAHAQGDQVGMLYKLPSDFYQFRGSDPYADGVQMNGIPLRFMDGPPAIGHFSLIDDDTNKWLWLPRQVTGYASVFYEKAPTVISSMDSVVDVDPRFDFFLVYRLVQWASIPKEGAQPGQLFTVAKQEANRILSEALNDKNTGVHARVRPIRSLRQYRDRSLYTITPR